VAESSDELERSGSKFSRGELLRRGGAAAFAVASLLALLALLTLGVKTFLEWKTEREYERAQRANGVKAPS